MFYILRSTVSASSLIVCNVAAENSEQFCKVYILSAAAAQICQQGCKELRDNLRKKNNELAFL